MEEFPPSFAGKALSALHELVPDDALASILHQTTYMQWPSSQSHLPDITNILQGMAARCFPRQGSPCSAKIIKHFLPHLHPDRHQLADFRLQYVSVALTAFLTRCQQLICGEQPDSDLRPLPRVFLTPFTPEGRRPPSGLELEATRLAAQADRNGAHAQHLRNNEERGTRPDIQSAECELWARIHQNKKHIPLGGCFRLGHRGWSAVSMPEGVYNVPGFTGHEVPRRDNHDDSAEEQGPSYEDEPSQGDANAEDNNQPSAGDPSRDSDAQQERMDDINDDNQPPEPDDTEEEDDIALDDFGLPKGHARATDVDIVDNKYATIDHLGWFQCAGFGQYSFAEAQHIPRKLQPSWAEAVGRVARDAVEVLQQAHPHERRNKRALDRRLKMWLLLPFLLLRKPPNTGKTRAKQLDATITKRMQHLSSGRWHILVREYETDVIIKDTIGPYRQQDQDERDVKTVSIALGHLAKNKC